MASPILSSRIRPASLALCRRLPRTLPGCIAPIAAVALLSLTGVTHGANYTWEPTAGGTLNWDNTGGENNWGPGGVFPNGISDIANITSNIAGSQTINLNQQITLGVLNLGDANKTHAFTIGAGTNGSFLFNNGAAPAEVNQSATSFGDTITANIATVGGLNFNSNSTASLVLTGSITSAATSGTQNITLTAGNVRLGGDIGDGSTGGRIAIVQSGPGNTSLVGNNTFTGGVTLNDGTLNLGSATALGAVSSVLTINGGALGNGTGAPVTITNNNAQVWAGNFAFNANSDVNLGTGAVTLTGNRTVSVSNATLTVGGVVSDEGSGYSLTKTGVGILSLKNANTYSGGTIVTGGRLDIQHAGALGSGTNVTATSGGTLQLQGGIAVSGKALSLSGEGASNAGTLRSFAGNNTWNGDISVDASASIARIAVDSGFFTINGNIATTGGSQFVLQGAGDGIVNGVISGTAPLTKSTSGAGTWTLTGANTYSGNTTISNGTLQIGNGGDSGTLGTGSVNIATIGTLAFNRANDLTVANSIAGSGAIIKRGAGNLTLEANNSFSGTTVIEAGTLTLGNASALRASTLNYNGQGGILSFGTLEAATLGNLSGSQNLALNNTAAVGVNLTVGANNLDQTYSGTLSGAGGLTKSGTGVLTLTNTHTYTGATAANGGTLQIGNGGTTGSLAPGNVSIGGSGNLAFNRSDDFTLTNAISGSGTLSKLGTGNLTVGADMAFAGTTVIGGGTLTLGTASALGASTLNYNRQGGVLSFGTLTAATLGNLRGSQDLALTNNTGGAVTLTLANNSSPTYSGALNGAGSLVKSGTGTLSLTGANIHTGLTTVNTGTLSIGNGGYSGSLASDVVNNATLRFSRFNASTYGGQISGSGALVKLGSGTLTLTGNNTYAGTTTVSSGTLLLDYSTSGSILPSTSALTLGSATLYVKGADTGTTTQTLGNFTGAASTGSKIVLDPNGGAGTTLVLGNTWALGGSNGVHFDLSRGGTVKSNPTQTTSVITGNGTVARVSVTDIEGRTYFATVNANGEIAPQKDLTPLAANSNSGSINYQLSGHLTTTAAVRTGTLRFDTTQTAGSLDIAGGNLTYDRTAILMDGSNDFEIKRSSGTGTVANVVIHHFGTGTLTITAPFASGGGFTKLGGGLLVGATPAGGGPASVTVADGIYRVATATAMPSNNLNIAGGIFELGSNDLTIPLGTGPGQARITADGGFSAFGATRSMTLGAAATDVMTWDNVSFLPNNSTFVLSSPKSDATLNFQNPIAMGDLTRTVQVYDGSAAIDAQLSGALTGTDSFVKTGPGALALTGASTGFTGTAIVNEGTLIVNGSLAGSLNVTRGTLQGNGDGITTGLIGGGVTVGDNTGTADAILSPGNSVGLLTTTGSISLNSDAQFKFELDSSASAADRMSANGISIASGASFVALDLATASAPLAMNTTFVVLNNTSTNPISGIFANLANGGLLAVGTNIFQANYNGGDGNDLALTVVPEPGSAALLAAGVGAMLGMRPRRRRTA